MKFILHLLFTLLALIAGVHQAGAQLTVSGPFVNNGRLDIINVAGSLLSPIRTCRCRYSP